MKSHSFEHVVDFSWNVVASLFWKRYPNPFAKHVISEDVLERKILADGRLYTKRAIMKCSASSKIPTWIMSRTPTTREVIIEESFVDPVNHKLETISRNVGHLTKYCILYEQCTYSPHSEETKDSKTVIQKTAWTESSWNSYLAGPLTSFILYRYKSAANNATKGLQLVCETNAESVILEGKKKITKRLLTQASVAKDKAKELANAARHVRQ